MSIFRGTKPDIDSLKNTQNIVGLANILNNDNDFKKRIKAVQALGEIAKSRIDKNKAQGIIVILSGALRANQDNNLRLAITNILQEIQSDDSIRTDNITTTSKNALDQVDSGVLWNYLAAMQETNKSSVPNLSSENALITSNAKEVEDILAISQSSPIVNMTDQAKKEWARRNHVASLVRGIFIASKINWAEVADRLGQKGYHLTMREPISKVVKNLSLQQTFPQKKFTKKIFEIPEKKNRGANCQVIINLKPYSMCRDEIDPYLKETSNNRKVAITKFIPLLEWMKDPSNKANTFYDLVEFTIICAFNAEEVYESTNVQETGKNAGKKGLTLDDSRLFAVDLSEVISEKSIYPELISAFEGMGVSPIIQFISRKWQMKLSPRINMGKREIRIGDEIQVELKVTNLNLDATLKLNRDFDIEVSSDYFTAEVQKTDELFSYDQSVPLSVKLLPKISEMVKKETKSYPVIFRLVDHINKVFISEETSYLALSPPDIQIEGERSFLPHKGSHINVSLTVRLLSKLPQSDRIPVKIRCNAAPDFKLLNSTKEEFDEKIVGIVQGTNHAEFILVANRAGFPGYKDTASFQFFIGEWATPFASYDMEMTVLPNMLDTSIAGLTASFVIFSQFFPGLIPSLTSEPNLATLSSTGAVIYLGFRAISWSLTTYKTKPKESSP